MLSFEEMPKNNAELSRIEVEFPHLSDNTPESSPVPIHDILRYLADESPGGDRLQPEDLRFLRTARVADSDYWIWSFNEADGGDAAYVTVSLNESGGTCVGYDDNYYDLDPEQYLLGDYHQVF